MQSMTPAAVVKCTETKTGLPGELDLQKNSTELYNRKYVMVTNVDLFWPQLSKNVTQKARHTQLSSRGCPGCCHVSAHTHKYIYNAVTFNQKRGESCILTSQEVQSFVKGAPVQRPPVPLQASTQRYSSWRSRCQRERGRLDFIYILQGYRGGRREREGCELISRYIVSCHFYTTQNALTAADLFSSAVDMLKVEHKWFDHALQGLSQTYITDTSFAFCFHVDS